MPMRQDDAFLPEVFVSEEFLCETLDWMNPWYDDTASFHEEFVSTEYDHYYPQL